MNNPLDLTKRFPNYFHRWIFITGFVFIAIIAIIDLFRGGFNFTTHIQYCCPDTAQGFCYLPNSTIRQAAGTCSGEFAPSYLTNFESYVALIVIAMFVGNHALWSRKERRMW